MANPLLWLEAMAGLKATYDLLEGIPDYYRSFRRYLADRGLIQEAERLSLEYSTYSDAEVRELIKRIDACRERFIEQVGGEERSRCLCSVLKQIKDGNGGTFPSPEWQKMWDQLGCAASEKQAKR
jgi:hypothetical protein